MLTVVGVEYSAAVCLDCANGVGGLPARALVPLLAPLGVQLSLINAPADPGSSPQHTVDPSQLSHPSTAAPKTPKTPPAGEGEAVSGRLNHLCGSDFVQVGQQWPQGLTAYSAGCALCASLDGDADRIVFYFSSDAATTSDPVSHALVEGDKGKTREAVSGVGGEGGLVLLDGDYIAVLVATYAVELVNALPIQDAVSVGALLDAFIVGVMLAAFQKRATGLKFQCTEAVTELLHVWQRRARRMN